MSRTYWLDLFTGTSWQEFLDAGGEVSGFREGRWKTVQNIKPGDYLLCYLTGLSRFIGILEVTDKPFKDTKPIWKFDVFPSRLRVKIIFALTPETAVPIKELKDKLSIFENLKSPHAWTGRLRGSPAKWKSADGEVILEALLRAKKNPIKRKVDKKKLERKPQAFETKIGPVTVPDSAQTEIPLAGVEKDLPTDHTEIQYLLLKIGNEMGFDVWVARNDRNRIINGEPFVSLFEIKEDLPINFDEATNKTIEYIDVLWLKGNSIVSAFEVESTTSIYSGLLRMSDLIAMQPNINIPLYLVAPEERREKVFVEVNRPSFSKFSPPLADVCRYISFKVLKEKIEEVESYIRYLKVDFLEELSEICDVDEL